ncbi:sugar-binding domain-containing protein [Gordonia rubripertincta]|uniref:MarR family transcriptional regulator n=2 Tax=Gordonia rubripertincta TaxID=36822 RepID=A0AAW4FYP9_GORRU|nr:sugar-binding domain-containing protein [Gordonia rubripertincta]ASR05358.1 Deoxyribonucleoside regulator [Gordonia rubripertincta]MBM7276317.1 MarR family transcriptional regulator [Gordonia rubripertincta]MDG6783587.1 sugar-binding domain-containing protein [Gordonia rubripertincta]NKY65711.1 MarR family transcriptional regulator [Gordonia rubripertincta]GAB83336.1 putative SorC family transcriptional regulator [Gordonia rubripertincta NBRC 101908]
MAPRKQSVDTADDHQGSSGRAAGPRGTDAGQDLRLLVRAATMYHLEGLTQAEIAARLGVSRPTAGRLVARARAQGLVHVSVSAPPHLSSSIHTELERAVEETFGLDEVLVIDEIADGSTTGNAALGRAGASVLTRRIQAADTFGFTWGPEQVAVADAMGAAASCQRVVQMDGSMTSVEYHTGVDHALSRFSERLHARPLRLVAPLYVDPETVTAVNRDSILSQSLSAARGAQVMLFGVGSVSTSTTLFEGAFIDAIVLDELVELGAVGEIGGRFYDADGNAVASSLVDRTVSVSLDAVRACPTSILVSGGEHRRESILGALRGGYATILVTDVPTAEWLVLQEKGEQ